MYLYDIAFLEALGEDEIVRQPENEKNENFYKEYSNRFLSIEKLTKKMFVNIPSFDQKVIHADWYSGTLYIKRFFEYLDPISGYNYTCDPNYELVIEKGEIKSIKETNYMIVKHDFFDIL